MRDAAGDHAGEGSGAAGFPLKWAIGGAVGLVVVSGVVVLLVPRSSNTGSVKATAPAVTAAPSSPETPSTSPAEDRQGKLNKQYLEALDYMRQHPEDWWWVYKRWKYRPPGATQSFPFYSKPAGEDRHASKAQADEADG